MTYSKTTPQLSKSRFMSGLQCLKRLYLECYERDLADPIDERQQAIFDTGTGVGELARQRYQGGYLVEELYFEFDQAVRTTEHVLADTNVPAIFEGAFAFEKIRIRADVLVRNDDGTFDLIEVKSTTSAKSQHIPDIAIQLYVLEGLGMVIRQAHLMHINNGYIYRGGLYDLDALFCLKDVTEEAREFVSRSTSKNLAVMWEALESEVAPDIDIGHQCTSPYKCPFYGHCHQEMTDYPIGDLPRASGKVLDGLKSAGIDDVRSIPADYPGLSDLQKRVRQSVVSGHPFIGPGLQSKLSGMEYPLSFLDFETFSPALPVYIGTKPYQSVPFQWSLHIRSLDGHLCHESFLWSDCSDPRAAFTESLIELIPAEGTIVAYSNYEQSIMKQLCELFPDTAHALSRLCDRTFDLLNLVREEYYHPEFHGSFSIKSVLPVLVPDMSYGDLEIQHGLIAAMDFGRMISDSTPEDEKEETREALLAYCERDTEAMVRVFDVLCSLTNWCPKTL